MRSKFNHLFKSNRTGLILFLIALPYLIIQNLHGGDFRILLTGAGYLRNGISPYGVVMPIKGGTTDVFLYSPFVGFVLMPLTYLPEFIPTFLFSLVNFFMLYRIWAIMGRLLQIEKLSDIQRKWWFILSIALTLRFILHNFEKAQMNIVVFYLSFEGIYLIIQRRKKVGSILLALGICLKLLPLVFLPYLVYRKNTVAAFATVLFCVALLFLPAMWFGFSFNVELLQGWWMAINPTQDKYNSGQNVGVYFHCISALVPVYFSDSSYNGLSVNFINLLPAQLFLLINSIRLFLMGLVIYFIWVVRSAKSQHTLFLFWELAYVFLLIPLIFPHQQKYSYINLIPAFGYMAYYMVSTFFAISGKGNAERNLLIASMLPVFIFTSATADIFWGMEIGKYFQFLKLVTIGTLLLIPVLAWFSPQRLISRQAT